MGTPWTRARPQKLSVTPWCCGQTRRPWVWLSPIHGFILQSNTSFPRTFVLSFESSCIPFSSEASIRSEVRWCRARPAMGTKDTGHELLHVHRTVLIWIQDHINPVSKVWSVCVNVNPLPKKTKDTQVSVGYKPWSTLNILLSGRAGWPTSKRGGDGGGGRAATATRRWRRQCCRWRWWSERQCSTSFVLVSHDPSSISAGPHEAGPVHPHLLHQVRGCLPPQSLRRITSFRRRIAANCTTNKGVTKCKLRICQQYIQKHNSSSICRIWIVKDNLGIVYPGASWVMWTIVYDIGPRLSNTLAISCEAACRNPEGKRAIPLKRLTTLWKGSSQRNTTFVLAFHMMWSVRYCVSLKENSHHPSISHPPQVFYR